MKSNFSSTSSNPYQKSMIGGPLAAKKKSTASIGTTKVGNGTDPSSAKLYEKIKIANKKKLTTIFTFNK